MVLALCRNFAEYDPGKLLLAWADGLAHLEVLNQRERNQGGTRHLTREVVEYLAWGQEQQEDVLQTPVAGPRPLPGAVTAGQSGVDPIAGVNSALALRMDQPAFGR